MREERGMRRRLRLRESYSDRLASEGSGIGVVVESDLGVWREATVWVEDL